MPLQYVSEPERPERGIRMNPRKVSALFAAYVWYTGRHEAAATAEKEALSFARENWRAFLPCAHKGLGRLLIRIAGRHPRRRRRGRTTAIAG